MTKQEFLMNKNLLHEMKKGIQQYHRDTLKKKKWKHEYIHYMLKTEPLLSRIIYEKASVISFHHTVLKSPVPSAGEMLRVLERAKRILKYFNLTYDVMWFYSDGKQMKSLHNYERITMNPCAEIVLPPMYDEPYIRGEYNRW